MNTFARVLSTITERAAGLVLDADVDPEVVGFHAAGVVDGDV